MKLSKILSAVALAALVACSPEFKYEVEPADTLELGKTTVKFLSDASTESIEVEASASLKVAVDTAAKWLSAEIAEGAVVVTAEANPDIFQRSGIVTVSTPGRSVDIKVSQVGKDLTFTLDNEDVASTWASASSVINVTSNVPWTIIPNVDWITPSAYEGTGNGTVTLTIQENMALSSRSGFVYFYHEDALLGRVAVNQAQLVPEVVFTPSEAINKESNAFTETIQVNANWPWTVYTSAADSLWITLTSPAASSDGLIPAGKNLSVKVDGLQTKAGRTGTIYFKTEDTVMSINIIQAGMPTTLSVSKNALSFDTPAAGSQTFSVTTNNNWEVTGLPAWISVSPATGEEGTHEITLSVTKREGAPHSGSFKVVAGDKEESITVSQPAGAITVDIPLLPWHLGVYGDCNNDTDTEKFVNPFTTSFPSGTSKAHNLGVVSKTLISNPEIVLEFFSNYGYVDQNTASGIRMCGFKSGTPNDDTASNRIRDDEVFCYIKFPALEGLTLKQVLVWNQNGGTDYNMSFITSNPLISNADAIANAQTDTAFSPTAKTEHFYELSNPQPNTAYYLMMINTKRAYYFRYIRLYYE